MKITYWVVKKFNDHRCYWERTKLRKDAFKFYRKNKVTNDEMSDDFIETPEKVTIDYVNSFDLVRKILSEGFHG